MKGLLLLLLLLLLSIGLLELKSQISFSCDYVDMCAFNNISQKFDICEEGYTENSLFQMNENETMITHTTSNKVSTYYIQKRHYHEKEEVYQFGIVSDIGNRYDLFIDLKNKLLKFFFIKDGVQILKYYHVKSVF